MHRKNIDHLGLFRSKEAENIISLTHSLRSALQLHPQSEIWWMLHAHVELAWLQNLLTAKDKSATWPTHVGAEQRQTRQSMTTTFLSNERRYAIQCIFWLHDLCSGQKKLWAGNWARMLSQFYDPQSSHKACINAAVKCSKKVKYTLVQPPETKKTSIAPLQNDACNCHIMLPSPELPVCWGHLYHFH